MRVLMTTGIFEPESGGPARLSPKIATRLVNDGHAVTLITYSDEASYDFDSKYNFKLVRIVRRGNRLLNYVTFFVATLRHMRGCDVAYSLDWFAAGFPVILASYLWRVPVVIRVGGDYAWDRYLDRGEEPMPMIDFYEKGVYLRYKLIYTIVRFVLTRANRVVFNSDIQREIYHTYYGLTSQTTRVIYNPVPEIGWEGVTRERAEEEIVFAGRFAGQKNIPTLVRAFAKAKLPSSYRLILIGEGPQRALVEKLIKETGIQNRTQLFPDMTQKEMYERIRNCRAIALPSWTDQSPNQVFEAMRLKIPMLVTQETYLAFRDELPNTIDPRSVSDVAAQLEMLADDVRYEVFVKKWNALSFDYDWDREMKEHYAVFDSVTR